MYAGLDRFAQGCACGRALSLPPCTRLQFRGAAHASRLRTQTLIPALQGSDFANVWYPFAFGDLHEPPIAVCVKALSSSLDEWKAGPVGPREPAAFSPLVILRIEVLAEASHCVTYDRNACARSPGIWHQRDVDKGNYQA